MPSTATTRNRFEKQASGENSNTWGPKVNVVWDMIDAALDGAEDIVTAGGITTLTNADYVSDQAKNRVLNCTGTGGTIVIPNAEKTYLVRNASSGSVIVWTGSGTSATILAGNSQWIWGTGANIVYAASAPNYGAANLSTTGTLASGALTVTGDITATTTIAATGALSGASLALTGAITGVTTISTSGNATLGDAVGDAHTVNGSLTVTSGAAVTGNVTATAGVTAAGIPAAYTGVNLEYSGATAYLLAYAGGAFKPLKIQGTTISLDPGGAQAAVVSGTGLAVTGVLTTSGNATLGDAVGDAHTVNGTLAGTSSILSSHATAGIGYATGAGGAVTQITGRTTGVTLNNASGAITLVSAAGTATWQSFTVTCSAVAATDVIRAVQKSGADKNMIHVTAVGAGSFEITFATTGGTTTEQPVFNFAVLKAVAA